MSEKIKGKDIAFFVNGIVVGCAEDCDIEISTSLITTTSKCSKDAVTGVIWEEMLPNINSVKFTGNGNVPASTSQVFTEWSFQQLALAQFAQLKIYVTWGIAGTNLFYGMDAYLITTKLTSPYNDVAKFSFTVNGTGKITTSAIS